MLQDWERIQWIPSDRSEECRVAGAYFFLFRCHFHVLIWKIVVLAVSLLTVTLKMTSNYQRSFSSIGGTCMIHSSIGMLLPGWRTRAWCYLLGYCRHFFRTFCNQNSNLLDLSAIEHWSPVRICSCYSSFTELLSYEKPWKHVYLELVH